MLLENPELEDKVPLYYLSHKEVYEQTMRKLAVTVKKVRELKEKDGGDYLLYVIPYKRPFPYIYTQFSLWNFSFPALH